MFIHTETQQKKQMQTQHNINRGNCGRESFLTLSVHQKMWNNTLCLHRFELMFSIYPQTSNILYTQQQSRFVSTYVVAPGNVAIFRLCSCGMCACWAFLNMPVSFCLFGILGKFIRSPTTLHLYIYTTLPIHIYIVFLLLMISCVHNQIIALMCNSAGTQNSLGLRAHFMRKTGILQTQKTSTPV